MDRDTALKIAAVVFLLFMSFPYAYILVKLCGRAWYRARREDERNDDEGT